MILRAKPFFKYTTVYTRYNLSFKSLIYIKCSFIVTNIIIFNWPIKHVPPSCLCTMQIPPTTFYLDFKILIII